MNTIVHVEVRAVGLPEQVFTAVTQAGSEAAKLQALSQDHLNHVARLSTEADYADSQHFHLHGGQIHIISKEQFHTLGGATQIIPNQLKQKPKEKIAKRRLQMLVRYKNGVETQVFLDDLSEAVSTLRSFWDQHSVSIAWLYDERNKCLYTAFTEKKVKLLGPTERTWVVKNGFWT